MKESLLDSEIVKAWEEEIRTTGRIREIGMPDMDTRIASGFYDDDPEEAFGERLKPSRVIDVQSGWPSYEAFAASDKTMRSLDIHFAAGIVHTPSYRYLLYVEQDEAGTRIILTFSFVIIAIHGRHMQALAQAIEQKRCAFVQEYNPQAFAPLEPSEPVIESIALSRIPEDNK